MLRHDLLGAVAIAILMPGVIAQGEELEGQAVRRRQPRQALQLMKGLVGIGLRLGISIYRAQPELRVALEEDIEVVLLHAVVDEFARERDINTITIILPARIGLEDALDLLHPLDLRGSLSALLLLPIAG